MSKLIGVVIIALAIVFLVMMQQRGWEGIKANPLESTIEASGTIADTGKDVFDKGKEIVENFKSDENNGESTSGGTLIDLGQIPCSSDSICNELLENTCEGLCVCINESCFLQS